MKKKTGYRFCDKQPIAIAVWWKEGKPVHYFGIPQFKGQRDDGVLEYAHSDTQTHPCTNPANAKEPAEEA